MTPDERHAKRLQAAEAISKQMSAARRDDAPPVAEAHLWLMVIDMDTNRPCWFPKQLSDEHERLRFTDEGSP